MTVHAGGEALLEAAFDHVYNSVVITDADFDGGGPFIRRCNPAFCEMTGYAEDELIGRSPRMLQGPRTDAEVIDRLRRNIRAGEFFEGSTINYRKDGTPYTVQWNISPVRDASGTVVAFISIQQDVTARLAAERERALLAQALNAATDPVIILDSDFSIVFANSAFAEETGQEIDALLHRSAFDLHPMTSQGPAEPSIRRSLGAGRPYRGVVSLVRRDGRPMYVDLSVAELVGATDLDHHYVVIAPDITSLVERQIALEEMANTDALTGLPNRRGGQVALELLLQESARVHRPICVAMADIDHFKSVNDRLGHGVGDDVLKGVGHLLREQVRSADTAVRWGGEEFLLLLPDTHLADGVTLAERIRHAVANLRVLESESVTISVGVAQWCDGETLADLVARADAALYAAKAAGRDRVATT